MFLYFIFSCFQVLFTPVELHLNENQISFLLMFITIGCYDLTVKCYVNRIVHSNLRGQQFFPMPSLSPSVLQPFCICGEIHAHTHRRPAEGPPTPSLWNKLLFYFPLSWWLMMSGLHCWWLFIIVMHVLNSGWTYSELIELTQISCSGTGYSEFPISE